MLQWRQPTDRVARQMLDTQLGEACAVAQAAAGQVLAALQQALGQGRSFVGHVGFVADQDQPTAVTLFAQGQRRTATGMAGADDNQGRVHRHAVTASSTRPASTRTG
ncbi:hypothetical protein [Pseudomonas sp. 24 E 13]|nr:hypothetical protein [Pseudomonas sp. 24 E 13]